MTKHWGQLLSQLLSTLLVLFLLAGTAAAQQPLSTPDTVSITLIEHPDEDQVDVVLQCEQSTCDAVALQLAFDPTAAQFMILDTGAFWQASSNPVHILRQHIDNQRGLIEFMYVTENQGGPPRQGSGTLLRLVFIRLSDDPPALTIVAAEVATLTGETVLRDMSDTAAVSTPTPTPAATPEPITVIMQVELEAALPDQIAVTPLNDAQISVIAVSADQDQAAFEIGLTASGTHRDEQIMVYAPAHLACYTGVTPNQPENSITLLAGDVNSDGRVDISDSAMIGLNMHAGNPVGDINRDGRVDILDLIHVGRNYGAQTGACGP